ncbi:PD-(D/E)XK nuclease superfamily protein [Halorubrum xinjiangense]|uniref:PD-(D/E)XK nuclease superfamily protein n=1 Tax=Halorubrum xinjiangense TaxID=261291 RepID=A0A1G7NY35_9EURY|nr:PD-(D/E)XK nuclease family protein [Halorubrum xinjiangense]SDF78269.1 PD-(D/E)XK nuclease superfamily protein [Halorubrum xinjiangense]
MPIRRAKPAESLYAELAEYDLVVTPDAALASAINRRLDRPHFGTFATTPRRLAAGRREQAEDRRAFLELVGETDHDWKAVAYAVGNVLQCWEHTGRLDAIFAYDAYVDDATREVVEVMRTLRTTSKRLSEYAIDGDRGVDEDQSVAVVGHDQLTNLERSVLPDAFDRVDLFTDEAFDYPPFHVFESATDIVAALLDTVSARNADRVAVVLDGGGKYSSLVESAFEAADIPFYGGPGFADDPHHRAFLRLLRLCFQGSETTVGDAAPVLSRLGIDAPIADRERRLEAVDRPGVEWLRAFRDRVEDRTFAAALDAYATEAGVDLSRLDEELESLGLADDRVTEGAVGRLAYYLQTYEVPVDRDNEGVILADAKSSAYVDRPVVFHLGMGEEWTHSAPQRPWVDTETQFERYVGSFQRLLQSGDRRYYLVQDAAGGEPITPCLYLGDLLDEEFERFSDLDSVEHRRRPRPTGAGFDRESTGVAPESVETVSQSSLNSYVNSPRDYLFGRLLDAPDRERFVEGNLFHDFAEFYVNHPEVVAAADTDDLVDDMVAEAEAFFSAADETLRRRKYRIGLELITEYLDGAGPDADDFLTPSSGWGTNFFAERFGEPVDSPLTERWFEDDALGVKGKIDLVRSPTQLLDYKSGRKKRLTQVVTGAATDPPADVPNFQAALYLTYYRTVRPDERLEFTFFHFLEPMADVIAGDADLDDALTTVTYHPVSFDEYVSSREAFDRLLDGYADCRETFEDLGYAAYEGIVAQLTFPETTDRGELRDSEFAAAFTAAVDAETAADVDAEKGVDQAIRELNGARKRAFFEEDLDAFEAFVEERLDELNARRAGEERFPVDGLAGEPNYRRVDNRDLLLGGDR